MEITNDEQVYHILCNLNTLEISYMDYSNTPKNYVKFQTYLDFFNNYVIKNHNLSRFYFPFAQNQLSTSQVYVSELDELSDQIIIFPGFNFSIAKQFNFPNPLRHKCNYFSCIYMLEGSGTIEFDNISFCFKQGDLFIIPPKTYYALETTPETICIHLNLRQQFVASEYEQIFLNDPTLVNFVINSLDPEHSIAYLILHTNGNSNIRHLLLTLFAEYINQNKYYNHAMTSYLSLLFTTILRDPETSIDSSVKINRLNEYYQQIVDYLKQNYQTATLSSTAEHIHFSKQYVCRIVKEYTGDTFNHLLIQTRIEMVRQLLMESDLSLENISYLCGFSAPSHMSKVFKAAYGISPSVYRSRNCKQ